MVAKIKYLGIGLLLVTVLFFMARTALWKWAGPTEAIGGPLLVWHGWDENRDAALRQSVATFVGLNPAAAVIVDRIDPAELQERFAEAAAAGFGPNLLIGPSAWIRELADQGLILPIGADLSPATLERYHANTVSSLGYQNQLYGLPLSMDTQILYYNRGLVAEPATTLDQLMAQGQSGIEIGINSTFSQMFWGIRAFGGRLFDESRQVALDRGGFANWLNWLKIAQEIPAFIFSTDQTTLRNRFVEGRLGYLVDSTTAFPALQTTMDPAQIGVAPLPSGPTGSAGPFLYVEAGMFSSASSAVQHALALNLAQFLTNAEQQTGFMRQIGKIPTNSRVRISPRLNPNISVFSTQARSAVPFPNESVIEIVRRWGNDGLTKMLEGLLTPAEAARHITAQINQELGVEIASLAAACNSVGEFTFWYAWEEIEPEIMEGMLADFRNVCPNIYIRAQTYRPNELMTRLATIGNGPLPDLLLIPHYLLLNLIENGMAQPISPLIESESLQRYRPAALNAFRSTGQLYGLPFSMRTDALVYNQQMVESPARTLDELSRQEERRLVLGQTLGFVDAFWGLQALGDVPLNAAGTINLDEAGLARWLSWLQNAQASGVLDLSADSARLDEDFVQGRLAYRVAPSNKLPGFEAALGRQNLGTATLPAGESGEAGPLIKVSGFVFNSTNEQRIPPILDFIRYMTGEQAQQTLLERASLIPSNASVELPEDSLLAPYISQLASAILYPIDRSFNTAIEFGGDAYVWLQSGVLSPDEAAREAVELVRQATGVAVVDPEGVRCTGTGRVLLWYTWSPAQGGDLLEELADRFSNFCPEIETRLLQVSLAEMQARLEEPVSPTTVDERSDAEINPPELLLLLAPDTLLSDPAVLEHLAPAQNLLDAAIPRRLLPVATQTLRRDGVLYGLPVSINTTVLYTHRGRATPAVATLADLQQQALLGNRASLFGDRWSALWGLGAFVGGPQPVNGNSQPETAHWPERSGLVEWFRWLAQTEGRPGLLLDTNSSQSLALFVNQRLAYYAGDSTQIPLLAAQMDPSQIEAVSLPAGPAGPATPLLRSQGIFFPRSDFGLTNNSPVAEAGLSFALYLTSAEAQTALLESGVRIPANRLVDMTRQPLAQAVVTQAATAIPYPPPGGDTLLQTLEELNREVLAQRLTPEQAADQLLTRLGANGE